MLLGNVACQFNVWRIKRYFMLGEKPLEKYKSSDLKYTGLLKYVNLESLAIRNGLV